MLYTDRMIIKKETILNKKTQLCKINKGDALRINEESDESRFTVYPDVPDVIVGTALPLNTPILTYGCDSNGIYHILYFAYCGTDSQNAAAVGISKTTFEKYGHDIYSDRFLCDLSVPREERLGALRLEDPIILVDDLGVALGVGTTDQEDIYLAKKYRQCLKASAYFSSDIVYFPQAIIAHNPFLLANPAVGFTYQECSDIAQASENSSCYATTERVAGLIRRQLIREEDKGHTWTDGIKLVRSAYNYASKEGYPVKKKTFYGLLDQEDFCRRQGIVVVKEQGPKDKYPVRYIFTQEAYEAEEDVAKQINRLMKSKAVKIPSRKIPKEIKKEEKRLGFKLAGAQKAALQLTMENNFCVVTGGPGTGKSTIIKGICEIFKQNFPKKSIQLLAPTGKAAQRMSECVDGLGIQPATTIHKALGIIPGQKRSGMLLDADMIIVDESSMIDIELASALLASIPDGSKAIFVGDPNQLPSIGFGSFLENLIESGVVPVTKLEGVFRQKSNSSVAINAARIRNNLTDKPIEDENFRFFEHANIYDSQKEIVSLYKELVKKGMKLSDICVLTPRRKKSPTGSDTLNLLIQEAVNPGGDKNEVKISGKVFRLNDRIMMTRNIGEVTNGDTGEITGIDESGITVRLDDDRVLKFEPDSDLAQCMVLGYAMTVHKSQGSEYKTIIMSLQESHLAVTSGPRPKNGVKRNLVYTGITRAKQQVFIVGQKSAYIKACQMIEAHTRRTWLVRQLVFFAKNQTISEKSITPH